MDSAKGKSVRINNLLYCCPILYSCTNCLCFLFITYCIEHGYIIVKIEVCLEETISSTRESAFSHSSCVVIFKRPSRDDSALQTTPRYLSPHETHNAVTFIGRQSLPL